MPSFPFTRSAIERHARIPRGTSVPGVGMVSSVRPPVYWKYVAGRYYQHAPVFIVTTTDGGRFKMVSDLRPESGTGTPRRIPALVQRLCMYPFEGFVPPIRYSNDNQLFVDFVSGVTLDKVEMTATRARRLGIFNGSCRFPAGTMDASSPGTSPGSSLDTLHNRYTRADPSLITETASKRVEEAFERLSNSPEGIPHVVTCADASLKNYVEQPSGDIIYVDLFGIREVSSGVTCVRQLFDVPSGWRGQYLRSFFEHASDAEHLREYLSEYCIVYLAGRLPRTLRRRKFSAIRRNRLRDKKAPFVLRFRAALERLSKKPTIEEITEWFDSVQ